MNNKTIDSLILTTFRSCKCCEIKQCNYYKALQPFFKKLQFDPSGFENIDAIMNNIEMILGKNCLRYRLKGKSNA